MYRDFVDNTNSKFNLISHNDLDKLYNRHFLDAIFPQSGLPELFVSHETIQPRRTLDVGCGAGFPGIPLAILNPGFQHLSVDSNKKKSGWIEELALLLGLKNVAVQSERAEEMARLPEYREQFDLVYARALAKPQTAVELVLPFLKIGGHGLFWASGAEWNDEAPLNRVSGILGCSKIKRVPYLLPDEQTERWIAVIRKVSSTPAHYPRRGGAMKRSLV